MPIHGNLDGVTGNSKPKYANTSSVYGVSVTEAANTLGDGKKVAHAGWVQQTLGTGPVTAISISAGGTGYSNGFLSITGGDGTGANASFTVNASGAIDRVTLLAPGSGYTSAPTVTGTGANTGIATLTATVGGRAGRRFYETLVASGSLTGDNPNDDTYFPGV